MIYNSAKADDYKWIIIQSYQTQDNKVIMNHFPNSKIFSSIKECESELVLTELPKNTPHRKAISRGDEIFVVEYWSNGSIHTSIIGQSNHVRNLVSLGNCSKLGD